MKALIPELDSGSKTPLYTQLYDYLRSAIVRGDIAAGERLPALRTISGTLGISVTTCQSAYDQLLVEGYTESRPGSGYYVTAGLPARAGRSSDTGDPGSGAMDGGSRRTADAAAGQGESLAAFAYSDPGTFDFVKWKKCFSKVINDEQEALLSPADPQGEHALRAAISDYLYSARGVSAPPDGIVIAAGVQQLTGHISRILAGLGITLVSTEDPGYGRVKKIFSDRGMNVNEVPVADDGIAIEKLPRNLRSAVYVSPSNQFPTGAVMPAARRYELLEWAEENGSVIIEDDYDSELRYFGKPLPPIKSLDPAESVIYLGSFSSTLFPAVRISYMALPAGLTDIYNEIKDSYDQTCSKAEQLTLAAFMNEGAYRMGIRKLRKLCAEKLERLAEAFAKAAKKDGAPLIRPVKTNSGMQLRLEITTDRSAEELCRKAASCGVRAIPLPGAEGGSVKSVAVYFDQIPLEKAEEAAAKLIKAWK